MRRGLHLIPTALLWLACTGAAQTLEGTVAVDPKTAMANLQSALRDLPAGAGKELTAIACTRCHNLNGLAAYKGYWNRAMWQAMVEGMVKHGAVLDASQVQLVTDYLDNFYGRTDVQ